MLYSALTHKLHLKGSVQGRDEDTGAQGVCVCVTLFGLSVVSYPCVHKHTQGLVWGRGRPCFLL